MLDRAPVVMGILNVTPDSFSDGGRFAERDAALAQRGAWSGRARRSSMSAANPRGRARSRDARGRVRRASAGHRSAARASRRYSSPSTPAKPEVMRAAARAGAGHHQRRARARGAGRARRSGADARRRLPDAHAGRAAHDAGRSALRRRGEEVCAFLAARIAACRDAGIATTRVAIDPGFGFGKNAAHNLTLLKHLGRLEALGAPLLVGLSRKSMLAKLTGRAVDERTAGSVALAAIAVLNGARIVRAHDVAATRRRGARWPRRRRCRERSSMARKFFGTDGVRGRVGEHPMTVDFALRWRAPRRACSRRTAARAHRQGHAPFRLHVRIRARGGLRRRRRRRHADRPVADAGHRVHHAQVRVQFRRRHQRLAQSLRRQRHQVLRRQRRQALRRDRGADRSRARARCRHAFLDAARQGDAHRQVAPPVPGFCARARCPQA